MFQIIFDKEAITFLNRLTKKLRERIFNKILSTKKDPFTYFKRLSGRTDYKLRIGDYRIIADINKNKKIIQILLIDHRKNVYKKHK